MDKLVSIIISTYHSETLPWVLDYLEKQTDKHFEVIISDDGSNDFKKIGVHRYPLRYVWHQDLGRHWSRTHNEGIKLASGQCILFLHDDILPDPYLVETVLKYFQEDFVLVGHRKTMLRKKKAIFNPEKYTTEEDHRFKMNKSIFDFVNIHDRNFILDLDLHFSNPYSIVSGCILAMPTIAVREVGGCPEDYPGQGYEDYDLALRLWRMGLKFKMPFGMFGYHFDHKEMNGPEVDKNIEEFKKRESNIAYTKNFNYFFK